MSACPPREILETYEQGGLEDTRAEPIERHLEHCSACRAGMERIRQTDDYATKLRAVMPVGGDDATDTSVLLAAAASEDTTVVRASDSKTPTGNRAAVSAADFGPAEWTIPDYERIALCNEGSYGTVWAVRDRVGVYRALKVIDLERLSRLGVKCREKSALEAYCRRVPNDPHLITIYHVGMVDKLLYYTMDLADDYTTRKAVHDVFPTSYCPLTLDIVLRKRALGVDVGIEIARRLLMGLSRLHELGLVHRDVKPSNIVFVNYSPKLADIGIVTTSTETGDAIGTVRYMPPDKVMDKTADTYALGKVLFEMLAGPGAEGFPVLPADRRWDQSRWNRNRISRVIAHSCADTADERYESATAMLNDLEQCVELTVESLFDDVEEAPPTAPSRSTAREAIELGYATIRALPWIFAIIALLVIVSLLTT